MASLRELLELKNPRKSLRTLETHQKEFKARCEGSLVRKTCFSAMLHHVSRGKAVRSGLRDGLRLRSSDQRLPGSTPGQEQRIFHLVVTAASQHREVEAG